MDVRWAVIGATGFACRRPLPALAKARGCSFYGVLQNHADVSEFVARFGVERVFLEMHALLADPQVDAVYIATPVHLHAEQTVAAAEAGKHVLVEKPMALTVEDARRMIEACEHNRVKLQIGLMRRFHPYHHKMKQIIDAGELGRIIMGRVQTHLRYPPTEAAWQQQPQLGGGGCFMDVGSHCLDMIEYLLGPITAVHAVMDNLVFDYEVEDTAVAIVRCASGAVGVIDTSFATSCSQNVVEVYGTEGSLLASRTAGLFDDPQLIQINAAGRREVPVTERGDQYQTAFELFADAVRTGRPTPVNGHEGLHNLELLLNAYATASRT